MYCLDTNAVIAVINERTPGVAARFDAEIQRQTPILIPTIVIYELRYGVARSGRPTATELCWMTFLRFRFRSSHSMPRMPPTLAKSAQLWRPPGPLSGLMMC